jgi:uncharacterized linocin/CFP29 family protein
MIKDLELAKRKLKEDGLTLAIVKDSKVLFESKSHGVSGFLEALNKLKEKIMGASVADKVVGKAIALLCVYAGVKAVYAPTMSTKAEQFLKNYGIHLEWDTLVENILDASGKGFCPFEKAATEINNPKEAYAKFKALLKSLKQFE